VVIGWDIGMLCGFLVVDASQVLPENPIVITSRRRARSPDQRPLAPARIGSVCADAGSPSQTSGVGLAATVSASFMSAQPVKMTGPDARTLPERLALAKQQSHGPGRRRLSGLRELGHLLP
jgi:hypothetical protein